MGARGLKANTGAIELHVRRFGGILNRLRGFQMGNPGSVDLTARSPVAPEAVKLYTSQPSHYEVIGLVRSESVIGWTQQDTNRAVANLKAEAAKLGANGVLLTSVDEGGNAIAGMLVGSGGGSAIWAGGVSSKAILTGQAIFVFPE